MIIWKKYKKFPTGMNKITLDRDITSKEMPEWAKEYFEELEPGNKD
jgi:hypothetical protein